MTVAELMKHLQKLTPTKEVFASVIVSTDKDGDWRQSQSIVEVSSDATPSICLLTGRMR